MNINEFLSQVKEKKPLGTRDELAAFEAELRQELPLDYREFLIACNGGFIGGRFWFLGPTPDGQKADAGIHHVGGFRTERYFSLTETAECYRDRIPNSLIWIMDDPFGNAICLGVEGKHRGKIFFWDHENEPDELEWDGALETAGNIKLLANSFTEFVAGLTELSTLEK